MILGSNLANMFSYIYHVILGRMLGPISYGNLSAFLNLATIFAAIYSFMGLVIVKYASATPENEISGLIDWFYKKAIYVGIAGTALITTFSGLIAQFLHIDYRFVLLVAVIFLVSIISFIYKSFLQGLLEFKKLAFAINIEMLARVIFGIGLVMLGFSVMGAIYGFVAASVLGLIILYFFIRKYKKGITLKTRPKNLINYALPVFVYSMSNLSIISSDVLLAKHFLSPLDAGIYASLSTLGKIIFFGTAPVSSVMFPIVSKRQSEGKNYASILFLSILMTGAISLTVLTLYFMVPELMVSILFGKDFLSAAKYLGLFGVFAAVFAVSSLIISYYLSKGKTMVSYIMALTAISQFIGIWLFHDSLSVIIKVSIACAVGMLSVVITYTYYEVKNESR